MPENTPEIEISDEAYRAVMRESGRRGARARWDRATPAQRRAEGARLAATRGQTVRDRR